MIHPSLNPVPLLLRSADTDVQAVAQHWLLWYLHFPWEEAGKSEGKTHGHGREIPWEKPWEGNPEKLSLAVSRWEKNESETG